MEHFFEAGNLIALREITLRRAANRVDEQMRQYLDTYSMPELWPVTERLLVCISGGPSSEKLIRTARRLAEELKTEWYTLYVETAGTDRMTQENRERIWRELRLAESLGAKEVATLTVDSAPQAVLDYARKHKITRVIVGRPTKPRWRDWLRGSFVDQILRRSKDVDIYVVGVETAGREKRPPSSSVRVPWPSYVSSLLLVAGATLISEIAVEFLSAANMIMIYLLAVVVAALRLGFKPAILTALVGVLAFDFFFVPPYFSFSVSDTQYLITFAGLFTVGAVISTLVARARSQTETIRTREAQTATLYALSRDLSSAPNLKAILEAIIHHVSDAVDAQIAILLPEGESLNVQASSTGFSLEEKQKSVALWAYRNGKMAGRGTDTLSSSELIYFPLPSIGRVVGVMAVKLSHPDGELPPESLRLLEAFAVQVALAIERAYLARDAEQAQLLQATDRLERSLLNSISHDLRTPLSSIMGSLSSLRRETNLQKPEARREMIDLAWEEAGRMNRFISNLLDITRLEAGALKIKKEPYDVQDLVGSCLASLEPRFKGKKVRINLPPSLPLVPMDSVLLAQVLNNLLENAFKYSPPEGVIEISARTRENWLEMEVADQGRGIPKEYLTQVFNKFFRISHNEETGGTGLGLAISKGIVEAHGGRIWAANRPEGGVRITFTLPLSESGAGKKSEA